jgi:hypothetical protein
MRTVELTSRGRLVRPRRFQYPVREGRGVFLAGVPMEIIAAARARIQREGYPSLRWVVITLLDRFGRGEVVL